MRPAVEQIPCNLAGSFGAACQQRLSLVALRYERPSYIAIIANLSVVWAFAMSMLVEGEPFNLENSLGGCCVVFGNVMIVLKKPKPYQGGGAPTAELEIPTGKPEIPDEDEDVDYAPVLPPSRQITPDLHIMIVRKKVKYGLEV